MDALMCRAAETAEEIREWQKNEGREWQKEDKMRQVIKKHKQNSNPKFQNRTDGLLYYALTADFEKWTYEGVESGKYTSGYYGKLRFVIEDGVAFNGEYCEGVKEIHCIANKETIHLGKWSMFGKYGKYRKHIKKVMKYSRNHYHCQIENDKNNKIQNALMEAP